MYPESSSILSQLQGDTMRTIIKVVLALYLLVSQTACVASVQMASRPDIIGFFDNRPRLSVTINATQADVYDITDDRNITYGKGILTGGGVIIPITITGQFGQEQRTFFVKGYRRSASDSTKFDYVGFTCRQVFATVNQQPQPWIVDRLIKPGDQASGCY